MTDKIHYSWATVEEYLSNELASDKGNEKRIIQSYNRVEKRAKEAKKKRGPIEIDQLKIRQAISICILPKSKPVHFAAAA